MTSGHAVVEQRERFALRAGDVLLVPAGEAHRWVSSKNAVFWGVGFCGACYAPSELATLLDPFERARAGSSAVIHIPSERQDHLASLCATLLEETTVAGPQRAHTELVARSLLALILAEVARAAHTTPSTGVQTSMVGDALRFIERNCLRPLSLGDVSAAVNKSPSYVTTALKRATGKSAVEWIIAGRLSEARNRLLHTDEFVDVIAERVGYADATHFIRLFRRAHGVTPAAWRAARRRP
ncbi:helix-turn-helix domain-containing protein [Enhygromyxa salina]